MTCVACESIHYCSADCQRADWRAHKVACKRTEAPPPTGDSAWFSVAPRPELADFYKTTISTKATNPVQMSVSQGTNMPPNPYGHDRFIIKVQRSMSGGVDPLLIYDYFPAQNSRTFIQYVFQDDPAFRPIVSTMLAIGLTVVKAYFYAQREGKFVRVFLNLADMPQNVTW